MAEKVVAPQGAPSFEELEAKGEKLKGTSNALIFGIFSIVLGVLVFLWQLLTLLPILWLTFAFMWFLFYILGIVFGAIAIKNGKKFPDDKKCKTGKILGTIGLIFSILGLVTMVLQVVLFVALGVLVGVVAAIIMLVSFLMGGGLEELMASMGVEALALLALL